MSSSGRFASLSDEKKQEIIDKKDSKKTKEATKFAVNTFRQYLLEKNQETDFEAVSNEKLNKQLFNFYSELRNKNGQTYKRSSMLCIRSGLVRFINTHCGIDIMKCPEFKTANDMFTSMLKCVSREGKGSVEHKVPLSKSDIDKLYRSIALNPSTPTGLVQKVWFELCMFFCRRGRENQRDLSADMFEIRTDETDGTEYVVQKDPEATKNHQGIEREVLDKHVRMYAKPNNPMCPVASFIKYLSKRNTECSAFFQRPRDSYNDEDEVWYENKPLGKNSLGNMMNTLSKKANLSAMYTNHCIRSTAITSLSHAGFEARHIMTVSGHRNEASVRSYVSDTTATQKRQMSEALSTVTLGQVASGSSLQADFDDEMDGALCLSLSQTEHMLKEISEFETNKNTNQVNDRSESMVCINNLNPVQSISASQSGHGIQPIPVSQGLTISNSNSLNISSNYSRHTPPVISFNSCSVNFYNYSN